MKFMVTDYIITIAFLYFFYRGWSRGFFRTLIGPIALVIGCFAGFAYYQKTQNLSISLLIAICGPIAINIYAAVTFKIWRKSVLDNEPISLISRLFGSAFSILWSGSYVAMLLLLIGMFPFHFEWFEEIQYDVVASKSYTFVNGFMEKKIPAESLDVKKIATIFHDPAKIEEFRSTDEFQNLVEDERLMAIMSDEEITEQIQNKNYTQLLSNPKIQAVFQNQDLIDKIFALNQRIMEAAPTDKLEQEGSDSHPKWIDIKSKQE